MVLFDDLVEECVEGRVRIHGTGIAADTGVNVLATGEDAGLERYARCVALVVVGRPDVPAQMLTDEGLAVSGELGPALQIVCALQLGTTFSACASRIWTFDRRVCVGTVKVNVPARGIQRSTPVLGCKRLRISALKRKKKADFYVALGRLVDLQACLLSRPKPLRHLLPNLARGVVGGEGQRLSIIAEEGLLRSILFPDRGELRLPIDHQYAELAIVDLGYEVVDLRDESSLVLSNWHIIRECNVLR